MLQKREKTFGEVVSNRLGGKDGHKLESDTQLGGGGLTLENIRGPELWSSES